MGDAVQEASHSVQECGCSWVSHSGQGSGPEAEGGGSPRSLGLETERGQKEGEVAPPHLTTPLSSLFCPKAEGWCLATGQFVQVVQLLTCQ